MFQRIFFSAIIAGVLTGLFVSTIHQITTVPLILEAEKYENTETKTNTSFQNNQNSYLILIHSSNKKASPGTGKNAEAEEWGPTDGIERTLFTSAATILTCIGFALLLTSGFALSKQTITGRQGVMWGLAGFAALTLAPALGLPPELPGSFAAELVARQTWWLAAAILTSIGLGLMAFAPNWIWRILGIAIIMSPHAFGAPHPHEYGSPVPVELGGHFATASLTVSFILWAMLGWISGTAYERLGNKNRPLRTS